MSGDTAQESPRFNVHVQLDPNAIEVLYQLFLHGPTWDGNVISKAARDQLFDLKLAGRYEGYSFLLLAGVRLAVQNGMQHKKESQCRQERRRLSQLFDIESMFVPRDGCSTVQTVTGKERPTVEGLQRLLEPEKENGRV